MEDSPRLLLEDKYTATLYALLTVEFPLAVLAHKIRSLGSLELRGMPRIVVPSAWPKRCLTLLEFQSRVPGSMSVLTLTSSGVQIGGSVKQKVDGCGSHLSFPYING